MALEYLDGDTLVIQADLPGVDPVSDIEISISHDVLHVRAYRELGPEPKDHPSDLRYGSFVRDIALPAGTTEDQVTATFNSGRLEIRAPTGTPTKVGVRFVPITAI